MLAVSLCAYAVEEVVQWRYGIVGAVAVGMVTLGHKVRSVTCTAIGLVALALLFAQ